MPRRFPARGRTVSYTHLALTPDQIEAIVTRYAEATGCDKSQLLPSFTAYITEYKEAEGVSVPKPKTQVIITGYDYLAYRQLQNNPALTLERCV